MLRVLRERETGTLRPVEQDESGVTIAPKLSKNDGWIDFEKPADECRRRVHGLTPWPGVTIELGGTRVKLLRLETVDAHSEEQAGTIVDAATGVIACGGRTAVQAIEVQPAGKRSMSWKEFSQGRAIRSGDRAIGGSPC